MLSNIHFELKEKCAPVSIRKTDPELPTTFHPSLSHGCPYCSAALAIIHTGHTFVTV